MAARGSGVKASVWRICPGLGKEGPRAGWGVLVVWPGRTPAREAPSKVVGS